MIQFKSSSNNFDDDNEFEIKESSSLLSNNKESAPKFMSSSPSSSSTNIYQAKANMQTKKDYANDNISSADYEKNKSFFNRYIFDPLKYQAYFDATEAEIFHKIRDAMWPFFPENQHHLKANDQEMIRDYSE
jgi:DNA-directed RNA polymerase specialized sigma54-like protein